MDYHMYYEVLNGHDPRETIIYSLSTPALKILLQQITVFCYSFHI